MKIIRIYLMMSYKAALALLHYGMLAWQTFDGLV